MEYQNDAFPVTQDGVVKMTNHTKWIAPQKFKDAFLMNTFGSLDYPHFHAFQGIEMPSHRDVLLGKGKTLQYHPGNNKMRHLCSEHLS